jgi:hypothetical protein
VLPDSSSQNTCAKQAKDILGLIGPRPVSSVWCQRIRCWHQAHTMRTSFWWARDWRDGAINAFAEVMRARKPRLHWRPRWTSLRLTVSTAGVACRQDLVRKAALFRADAPVLMQRLITRALSSWGGRSLCTQAGRGSPSAERRALSRHGCITASADTIANRECHRSRHPVPDDMLLAPRTDDLESGQDRRRVRGLPSFMHGISLVFHRCSPSPRATDSRTRQRSRPAPSIIGYGARAQTSCPLKGGAIGVERDAHAGCSLVP